jgi:hypothetical protein
MNAISIVIEKANEMIDKLWEKEIKSMEDWKLKYFEYLKSKFPQFTEENKHEVNYLNYIREFVFNNFNPGKEYNHKNYIYNYRYKEINMLENRITDSFFPSRIELIKKLFYNKNISKLERSLNKYLTSQDMAESIVLRAGVKGIELELLLSDGRKFNTFALYCGGDIQCYHYRYYSTMVGKNGEGKSSNWLKIMRDNS